MSNIVNAEYENHCFGEKDEMKPRMSSTISTRISAEMKKKFNNKAKKYGDPSYVHRELIHAFVEDRLTIEPPEDVRRNLFNKGDSK